MMMTGSQTASYKSQDWYSMVINYKWKDVEDKLDKFSLFVSHREARKP